MGLPASPTFTRNVIGSVSAAAPTLNAHSTAKRPNRKTRVTDIALSLINRGSLSECIRPDHSTDEATRLASAQERHVEARLQRLGFAARTIHKGSGAAIG